MSYLPMKIFYLTCYASLYVVNLLFEMLKFIQSSFMRKLKIIESNTGHTIFNCILFKTNAARCLFKILINAMLF